MTKKDKKQKQFSPRPYKTKLEGIKTSAVRVFIKRPQKNVYKLARKRKTQWKNGEKELRGRMYG